MGFMSIAKPLAIAVSVGSGAPLEGRVALGPQEERPPLGLPGDLPQGFGGLAGVPRCAKSDETTRWTRIGVRCPAS